jgi:hypothetical protein
MAFSMRWGAATPRAFWWIGGMSAALLTGCPEDESDGGGGGASGGTTQGSSSATGATSSSGSAGSTSTGATTSATNGAGGDTGSGGAGGSSSGSGGEAPVATHTGLVSLQDISIHGAPQVGHGLSVQISFAPATPPDFEELPGNPAGCKAWVYDLETNPPPPALDEGAVVVEGLGGETFTCAFEEGPGYVCTLWSGEGDATLTPGEGGTALFEDASATFGEHDVGRHLRVDDGLDAADLGTYPIVAVLSETQAVVFHPGAAASSAAARWRVVAGGGPVPNNPNDPVSGDERAVVTFEPGGAADFGALVAGPITPGSPFVLDTASDSLLSAIPLDGAAFTLGCGGDGGQCGAATATIVRLTSTDGDVSGLSPFAMPPPARKVVDILCADLGPSGLLTVPEGAAALLAAASAEAPITRVRTALMREGLAIETNEPPLPPNPIRVLIGHGLLGFTSY